MGEHIKNAFVWVAGGRNYFNGKRIHEILSLYSVKHGIRRIVTGAQRGADLLAEEWARKSEIAYVGLPAEWTEHDKAAGPIRNERIATEEQPDLLIAFPGGPGTVNAIKVARSHGIRVIEIDRITLPGEQGEGIG